MHSNNIMDITLTPDTYAPSVNDNGDYIDRIPIIYNGIYCICGTKRDKIYDNASKLSAHLKTKKHQKWLVSFNQNKSNHYVEMLKHKEMVDNQQQIITKLTNELQQKKLTIEGLTVELVTRIQPQITFDLLNIN